MVCCEWMCWEWKMAPEGPAAVLRAPNQLCSICFFTFFVTYFVSDRKQLLDIRTAITHFELDKYFFFNESDAKNIVSWSKVLRMTQILIFTKFAASVSLGIFVRCYYGILKYNYKHFISLKGFYWQLHEVDTESIFAVLTFFKNSAIRPVMLSINFWATSWLMAAHSCIINAWSLSEFVCFCLSTRLLRIDHTFSMGLRWSGEFPGHGPKISMFCYPSHLVNTLALW